MYMIIFDKTCFEVVKITLKSCKNVNLQNGLKDRLQA